MLRALILLAVPTVILALGRTQSVGVKGQLICEDKPAVGVKIKIYDEDKLSPDELMVSGKTDSSGRFDLKGSADEFTSIEPKINIYHDCDDGIKPCQRKITVYIPSQYISSGKDPKKIFDFGTLQLAGKFSGETRDCLN
ncbi:Transthyretin-like family protein [Caenorhabditis elegans]|uniref:Transthyretin-like family protein n=1 Tax=Caenorhabditis elegans TaxID=6239 RepID=Q95Y93_CAEEL|nr:Transthyretin-like family protein [Caenorhabditis elegans]CCD63601.1 Transthyretin-like family protein [Caenorhabditis elegans]|eukprot:NP_498657.1 TransThyretin-Related family domain [Caenorhabditis elegans]